MAKKINEGAVACGEILLMVLTCVLGEELTHEVNKLRFHKIFEKLSDFSIDLGRYSNDLISERKSLQRILRHKMVQSVDSSQKGH